MRRLGNQLEFWRGSRSSRPCQRATRKPGDGPRVGAEPEAAIANSADRSRLFPTYIDLTIDEPFFSDELLLPPPATMGESTATSMPCIAPPAAGLAELNVQPTFHASLQLALVAVPMVCPAVPRLDGSLAVSSSSAPAQGLVGSGSEAQGTLPEVDAATWINSLSHMALVGLML